VWKPLAAFTPEVKMRFEIVLSKEGVVFRRKRNPIVIQRIPNIEEVSGGRVLKLTGLTSEGKTVKRR